MANYYATARSNYFAVKNEQAFREWADGLGLTILEPQEINSDGIPRFGISPGDCDDSGGWPNMVWNGDSCDYDSINVFEQLSAHLADDEVAILMEVGSEKLRYMTGFAAAVNHKCAIVCVDLEVIYESALTLGKNITRAEY